MSEQPETENFDEENPLELAPGKDENSFVNLTDEIPAIGAAIKHPAAEILFTKAEDATVDKKNSADENVGNILTKFSDEVICDFLTKLDDIAQSRQEQSGQSDIPLEEPDLAEEISSKEILLQIIEEDNQAPKPEADKEYLPRNRPVEQARLF